MAGVWRSVVREAGLLQGVSPGIQHDLDHCRAVEIEVLLSAAFDCEQEL